LTLREPVQRSPVIVANMGSEAMIDWPWKLIKEVSLPVVPKLFASEDYYLYDLGLDPEETKDLAQTHPKVFGRMVKDLQGRSRRTVIELNLSEDSGTFGGEVNRKPWAESVLDSKDINQ